MVEVNLLTGQLKVRLESAPDVLPKAYHRRDVRLLKDVEIKLDKNDLEALSNLEES